MQTETSLQLIDRDNLAVLPESIQDHLQSLASWIAGTVQDPNLSEEGVALVEATFLQLSTMMQQVGQLFQETIDERDTALHGLAVTEEELIDVRNLYKELQNAVLNRDEDHDLVRDLLEQFEENMGEAALDYAYQITEENFWGFLQTVTGLDEQTCKNAAFELTSSEPEPSDQTIYVLSALVSKLQKSE